MRPIVTVYNAETGLPTADTVALPEVFSTPIRDDVVQTVFTSMNKNRRQAHGVSPKAGHQHSAESWGTGRAVSRIPRISGGGTHRSGQGAFGNMCRGGHMFAPNKIWRRWHRKINVNTKRFATAAAVAATGVTSLVLARGHRVSHLPEVPLVVSHESLSGVDKTKKAVAALKKLGAYEDVQRVLDSRRMRAGKGKMRNRRFVQRKGPLVVYKNKGTLCRAFRNIPGVDLVCVSRMNLLELAPGGHLGRFVIWTSDAFAELDRIFSAEGKKGFVTPRAKLSNASITRIMRSEEVRAVLRKRMPKARPALRRRNPLRNFAAMVKLNPHAAVLRKKAILAHCPEKKRACLEPAAKKAVPAPAVSKSKAHRLINKQNKEQRKAFLKMLFA